MNERKEKSNCYAFERRIIDRQTALRESSSVVLPFRSNHTPHARARARATNPSNPNKRIAPHRVFLFIQIKLFSILSYSMFSTDEFISLTIRTKRKYMGGDVHDRRKKRKRKRKKNQKKVFRSHLTPRSIDKENLSILLHKAFINSKVNLLRPCSMLTTFTSTR